MDLCKDKSESKFHRVYHCDNEYYKISLNVVIDYDTFDIIYSVTNESSTNFNGIIEVCSSMLGSKKCKKILQPQETITFEGNLQDSIIYNGEFKEDISVAYLRFPESSLGCCSNFVMSNKITIKPLIVPIPKPENWIYSISFLNSTNNIRTIYVLNTSTSNSDAKDIHVEMVYFVGIQLANITIDPTNEYPNEITLDQDKFTFDIPSLIPGEFRVYKFRITNDNESPITPSIYRISSSTPFLFQLSHNVFRRMS